MEKRSRFVGFFWKDSKFERKVRNVRGSVPPLLRDRLAEKIGANNKNGGLQNFSLKQKLTTKQIEPRHEMKNKYGRHIINRSF